MRLSFFWPQLRLSVRQYVNTCAECQLRSRPVTLDRVPITPITRVDVPFQVLNMDCIRPIDRPSAQGHKAPCGLRGCKNGPAPFPGRMSYKATKPGLVFVLYLNCFFCVGVY